MSQFGTLVDGRVVPLVSKMEQRCRVLMSAVDRARAVPYVGIMVFEAGSFGPLSSLSVVANTKQL